MKNIAYCKLRIANCKSQICNLQSAICNRPSNSIQRAATAALLAAVVLLPGCGDGGSREESATRVILPGEQQLTIPEVAEAPAETTAALPPGEADPASTSASVAATTPAAGETPAATPAAATPSSEPAAAAPQGESTGTNMAAFKGRVTVAGTPPTLSPLVAKDDPKVKDAVCVAQAVPDESVIVGDGGGLANVFVYAKKVPSGVEVPPAPTEPVVIDQVACRFIPQAMVFRVGQPLLMKNSDPVSHNVRTAGFTQQINQIISPNDQTGIPVSYSRPERVPVQTKCDIHAWMLAYHFPLDHPYAAVTGPDGSFEINDLPPGDWEFVVWHGKAGNIEKSVKFKAAAGQVVAQDFSVPAADLSR